MTSYVAVPEMIGLRAVEAFDLAVSRGVSAVMPGARSGSLWKGTVYAQVPAPGTRVRPGELVTVWIAPDDPP